jgi:hypothetical protein
MKTSEARYCEGGGGAYELRVLENVLAVGVITPGSDRTINNVVGSGLEAVFWRPEIFLISFES